MLENIEIYRNFIKDLNIECLSTILVKNFVNNSLIKDKKINSIKIHKKKPKRYS
jgi:hypothetical protein